MKKIVFIILILIGLVGCSNVTTQSNSSTTTTTAQPSNSDIPLGFEFDSNYVGKYNLSEIIQDGKSVTIEYEYNYIEIKADATFELKNKLENVEKSLIGEVYMKEQEIVFLYKLDNVLIKEFYKVENNNLMFESNIGDIAIKLIYSKEG